MMDTDKAIKLIRELGSMGLLACVLYFTLINGNKYDDRLTTIENNQYVKHQQLQDIADKSVRMPYVNTEYVILEDDVNTVKVTKH